MRNIVGLASGKGGVGKSSLSVFLSRELCRMGNTVLLLEMGAGLRCLDALLGIEQRVVYDISDLASGRCGLEEGVLAVRHTPGLYLMAAPGSWDTDIPPTTYRKIFGLCADCYDWIVVDFPAGFSPHNVAGCALCSTVINVVTPDVPSIRAGGQFAMMLQGLCTKTDAKTVINMVPPQLPSSVPDLDAVVDSVGLALLGVIPQSEQWGQAVHAPEMLPAGLARRAVENIAARLCGQQRPLVVL